MMNPPRQAILRQHQQNSSQMQMKRRQENESLQKMKRDRLISAKRIKVDEENQDLSEIVNDVFIKELETSLKSSNSNIRIEALRKFQKTLLNPTSLICDFVINGSAVNLLINSLENNLNHEEQLDAIWCISSIGAGTSEMCEKISVTAPYLISYLSSPNTIIQDQAALALGNIAGDSVKIRDLLISNGIVIPLVNLLENKNNSTLTKTVCFAISNLMRGQSPNYSLFTKARLFELLFPHLKSLDPQVVSDSFHVLSYFTLDSQISENLMNLGIFSILVEQFQTLISHGVLILPIIRTLGNLSCYIPTSHFVNNTLLSMLFQCLFSDSKAIIKESLWVFSNLFSGENQEIQIILQNEKLIEKLMQLLKSEHLEIQREVFLCLLNISSHGSSYIDLILNFNGLIEILNFLQSCDRECVFYSIQFLEDLLALHPQGKVMFENVNGLGKLESLQFRGDDELLQKISSFIDAYLRGPSTLESEQMLD